MALSAVDVLLKTYVGEEEYEMWLEMRMGLCLTCFHDVLFVGVDKTGEECPICGSPDNLHGVAYLVRQGIIEVITDSDL